MASTYLTRSVSSTGNRRKWTWSGWLKRSALSTNYIMSSNNGSNQYAMLQFDSTDVLRWYDYTTDFQSHLKTNRKFRDTNAWYHIVVTYDSAQATAADRIKFYVNGVQETSFGTSSYPSQNYDSYMNYSGVPHYLGRETGTEYLYNGIMSHVHFCDGYAYSPSDFGSTDSTTGEWKINTSPSVSYGTNGYFMFKDDASLNDDSGNGNNFSLTAGTLTKTEDNPSNVFCTLNPLNKDAQTLNNGNTQFENGSGANWRVCFGNLAATSGKYYCEVKMTYYGGGAEVGVANLDALPSNLQTDLGSAQWGWSYYGNDGNKRHNNSSTSFGTALADNIIVGIAMDLDNYKLYFSRNGTWQNSGDPTSGSTGTGSAFDLDTGGTYAFAFSSNDTGTNPKLDVNFGNGLFGTTAVSSAGTNASGNGIFEYDCPSGYTALSTKGLNL